MMTERGSVPSSSRLSGARISLENLHEDFDVLRSAMARCLRHAWLFDIMGDIWTFSYP
jgi:hypothetical protein